MIILFGIGVTVSLFFGIDYWAPQGKEHHAALRAYMNVFTYGLVSWFRVLCIKTER